MIFNRKAGKITDNDGNEVDPKMLPSLGVDETELISRFEHIRGQADPYPVDDDIDIIRTRISNQSDTIAHLTEHNKKLQEQIDRMNEFIAIQLANARMLKEEATLNLYRKIVEGKK